MYIVTGANGFIGSNLAIHLSKLNQGAVYAIDFESNRGYLTNQKNIFFIPAKVFYSDLKNTIKSLGTPKVIFHEGAISSTTETDWSKLLHFNINCSLDLIYYCRNNNIPLQYASSASVYGNLPIEEWKNSNKNTNPLNLYAKSKQQIDYVSSMIMNSKMPPKLIQGMRYFNVYGPNEDHKGDQASPYHKFKKQLQESGKIKLFEGSKDFFRDFISVEELIQKKLYCLENKPSGIYDVGTGTPKSFYDVALEIGSSSDVIEWIPMPSHLEEHYQKYSCAVDCGFQ
jgi:ADP-L-glycero-D-manno-heptose 6-epimerase